MVAGNARPKMVPQRSIRRKRNVDAAARRYPSHRRTAPSMHVLTSFMNIPGLGRL